MPKGNLKNRHHRWGRCGFAAAEMLRRQGYQGSLVMLSSDTSLPYDRPNLSKDYLAGTAPFEYVPLKDERFYTKNGIETRIGWAVRELDVQASQVVLAGEAIPYDRLLLATGAEPVRLTITGRRPATRPHAALVGRLPIDHRGRQVVTPGCRHWGKLYWARGRAALRKRELEVHVVAPDKRPMERVLGTDMGNFIRSLHEQHGVVFHLENKAIAIDGKTVRLKWRHDRGRYRGRRHRGSTTPELAEQAGLTAIAVWSSINILRRAPR